MKNPNQITIFTDKRIKYIHGKTLAINPFEIEYFPIEKCNQELAIINIKQLKMKKPFPELAARFGIHPTMIHNWKRSLLDGAADVFDKGQKSQKSNETKVDELYKQIGKLKVANDFLSEKLNDCQISQPDCISPLLIPNYGVLVGSHF